MHPAGTPPPAPRTPELLWRHEVADGLVVYRSGPHARHQDILNRAQQVGTGRLGQPGKRFDVSGLKGIRGRCTQEVPALAHRLALGSLSSPVTQVLLGMLLRRNGFTRHLRSSAGQGPRPLRACIAVWTQHPEQTTPNRRSIAPRVFRSGRSSRAHTRVATPHQLDIARLPWSSRLPALAYRTNLGEPHSAGDPGPAISQQTRAPAVVSHHRVPTVAKRLRCPSASTTLR